MFRQVVFGFALVASALTTPVVALEPTRDVLLNETEAKELLSAQPESVATQPQLEPTRVQPETTIPEFTQQLETFQVQAISAPETLLATPEFSQPQTLKVSQPEPTQENLEPSREQTTTPTSTLSSPAVPETLSATPEFSRTATHTLEAPKPPPESSQVLLEPSRVVTHRITPFTRKFEPEAVNRIVRFKRKLGPPRANARNQIVAFRGWRLEPTRATFRDRGFWQTELNPIQSSQSQESAATARPMPEPHGVKPPLAKKSSRKSPLEVSVTGQVMLANRVDWETALGFKYRDYSFTATLKTPANSKAQLNVEAKLPVTKATSVSLSAEDLTAKPLLSVGVEHKLFETLTASARFKNINRAFDVDGSLGWEASKTTKVKFEGVDLASKAKFNVEVAQQFGSLALTAKAEDITRKSSIGLAASLEVLKNTKVEVGVIDIFQNVGPTKWEGKLKYEFSLQL